MFMHTKFPASVMVLRVVSNEGHVMPPHFLQEGLRVNSAAYIEVWVLLLSHGSIE